MHIILHTNTPYVVQSKHNCEIYLIVWYTVIKWHETAHARCVYFSIVLFEIYTPNVILAGGQQLCSAQIAEVSY